MCEEAGKGGVTRMSLSIWEATGPHRVLLQSSAGHLKEACINGGVFQISMRMGARGLQEGLVALEWSPGADLWALSAGEPEWFRTEPLGGGRCGRRRQAGRTERTGAWRQSRWKGGRDAEKMKGHSFNRCDTNRIGNSTALMERSCLSLPLTLPESLGN